MNLFKSIDKHLESVNLNITVTKNGDKLSVSVLPQLKCDDPSKSKIVPLMLKGTPEELDNEFVNVITAPLEKVSGISSNLIQFEHNVKEMEAATKLAEEEKKKTAEADKKAEKKLETAQKWFDKEDYKKAGKYTIDGLKLSPTNKKCLDMLKAINEKDATLDLEAPEIKEDTVEVKTEKPTEKKDENVVHISEVHETAVKKLNEKTKSKPVPKMKVETGESTPESIAEIDENPPENLVTERPPIKKSKEELDIDCNSKVNEALPFAEKKDYQKAKEILEQALEIQPKHQRANIAYKKVLQWIEESQEANDNKETQVEKKHINKIEVIYKKPKRENMESMESYKHRLKAWEESCKNGEENPFKEEEKQIVLPERKAERPMTPQEAYKAQEEAFESEGKTNSNTEPQQEEEDDEF